MAGRRGLVVAWIVGIVASVPAAAATRPTIGELAAQACEVVATNGRGKYREIALCDRALTERTLPPALRVATLVNRGIVKLMGGRTRAATADFDRALALAPDQPEAWLNKGLAAIAGGDVRAATAVPLFDAALQHGTRRPELAYYGRAVAQESRGNVRAAYHDYRRAAALAPGWAPPKQELARFKVLLPRPGATAPIRRG